PADAMEVPAGGQGSAPGTRGRPRRRAPPTAGAGTVGTNGAAGTAGATGVGDAGACATGLSTASAQAGGCAASSWLELPGSSSEAAAGKPAGGHGSPPGMRGSPWRSVRVGVLMATGPSRLPARQSAAEPP